MVSINSKHGELKEFYKHLSDFENHKPITIETKNRKNIIVNNVNQLYNKYLDTNKKNCISENSLWFEINKKEFEELTGDI